MLALLYRRGRTSNSLLEKLLDTSTPTTAAMVHSVAGTVIQILLLRICSPNCWQGCLLERLLPS
jgi:hypothetical protein